MMNLTKITGGIDIDTQPLPAESGFIPHRIAVFGRASAAYAGILNKPVRIADYEEAVTVFGAGSQLAELVKPLDGVAAQTDCFVLEQPDAAQTKSLEISIDTAPDAAGYACVAISGTVVRVDFLAKSTPESIYKSLEKIINEQASLPLSATSAADKLTLTSKWDDESANLITVSTYLESENAQINITETQATGKTTLNKAFEAMGNTWYTMGVLPYTDAQQINAAAKLAEERMKPEMHMPMLIVAGNVQDYAGFNTLVQQTDSMAMQIVCVPGSTTMPGIIAADEVYKRIMCSQSQPNLSGRNIPLRYTQPGPKEFTPAQKEAVVRAGGSTVAYIGNAVCVDNDATTSKTVGGKKNDIWRWASTVLNYMAKIHSLKNMLKQPPFDDYIMMNDAAVTDNPKALKPGTVKQYMSRLMSQWNNQALSKNLSDMQASVKVSIPKGNVQSYLIEYMDDMAVAGKHIFVYNTPVISSKV